MNQENLTLKVDPQAAPALFGQYDQNLRQIAEELGIDLTAQDNTIYLSGDNKAVNQALAVLEQLKVQVENGLFPGPSEIKYALDLVKSGNESGKKSDFTREVIQVTNRGKKIYPRTVGQKQYIDAIRENSLTFGIGPAGTGKTYLAVTTAVAALQRKEVARIILTRPAVEAGEKLGFLPGDLQEKVDPYLRPLYDALFDLLGVDLYQRYSERRIIEIAPLAYMRGRTLEDSFIILDEAQNTTPEQMKMFLTRMGFGSKMVVTGDITQVDLPKGEVSGLVEVARILEGIPGIAIVYLTDQDVVRHELVKRIIRAYERYENRRPVKEP
ncbi:MAG TPA: PhoH family protein [Firmicutes bacterium]|nr:PhoH family protein [Bacillota bacterium]